jgi:hypothetical protein
LKLDYGCLHIQVVIFRCEWIKQEDNRGNPTYEQYDVSFFTVNFRHKLSSSSELFIFPFQTTQVFFSDDIQKPSWKVVLWKEAHSRREMANIENVTTRILGFSNA